jgi:hypothetical protein
LWKFLRSVLCSSRIADQVQEADIRNWTFGLVHDRGRLVLGDEDFNLVQGAIHTAGLERIEARVLQALPKADPRPLMALLLANLRNLITLHIDLPATDIFFAEVLQQAAQRRQDQQPLRDSPLRSLRELHLASAWNFQIQHNLHDEYTLKLDHLWPVFRLPSIQKLSLFDLEPVGASILFGSSPKSSSITELILVHHRDSLLTVPDTSALLALPKALTSLSIYWDDYDMGWGVNQLSNADLWRILRQQEDSLEHLDFYRGSDGCSPPQHTADNSYFGTMQGFKRLRSLCIQPEALLGGCCGDDYAPFHLRDTLPQSLESLTLYGDEGLSRNKTLGRQLRDVVADTEGFPLLSHVALEATSDKIQNYTDPADPPHDEVERACRESGRRYETLAASSCTKGGLGRPYYRERKEERDENNWMMSRVGRALVTHLTRLRREAGDAEGGSAAVIGIDRSGLSSEDLDTYELPWDELCPEEQYGSECEIALDWFGLVGD